MTTPTSNSVPCSAVSLTGQHYIDALIDSYKWGSGSAGTSVSLTYSCPGYDSYWATDYYGGEPWDFDILNATQKAAATSALSAWANVANISFTQAADNSNTAGDIRFAWTGEVNEQAHAYSPGSTPEAGDVWLNYNANWDDGFGPGTYGYSALIHELGPGLGLKHTFEGGAALPSAEDSYHNSVMSYTGSPAAPTQRSISTRQRQCCMTSRPFNICTGRTRHTTPGTRPTRFRRTRLTSRRYGMAVARTPSCGKDRPSRQQ